MQKASEAVPSAMCSVVGCDDATLNKLIAHVRENSKGRILVCVVRCDVCACVRGSEKRVREIVRCVRL
jgi:hypothetical protein